MIFTVESIAAGLAKLKAVTEGPWDWDNDGFCYVRDGVANPLFDVTTDGDAGIGIKTADAEFVADARTTVPEALTALARVYAIADALNERATAYGQGGASSLALQREAAAAARMIRQAITGTVASGETE